MTFAIRTSSSTMSTRMRAVWRNADDHKMKGSARSSSGVRGVGLAVSSRVHLARVASPRPDHKEAPYAQEISVGPCHREHRRHARDLATGNYDGELVEGCCL